MNTKWAKIISASVFLTTIAIQSKPASAQTYTTSGNQIQSNGSNWCGGGANAFDQFGPGSSSGHGIKVMREVVENLSGCIMGSGVQSWNGSYLSGLQDVVNNNRSQGEITILCPFSWDTSGVITGGNPSSYSWYNNGQYASQLAAMAAQFAGQSDVWIDPWNEPNFSSQTDWNSYATTVYNAIRGAGNNNIILMPSNNWDSDEGSYINGTGWLSGKSNVTATIHIYSGWDWDSAANIQSRLQNILNSGWPVIVGEIGPDGYQADPIRGIQATLAIHIPTLAWAWNSGDGDQLQNGGVLTSWGNEWFGYIDQYVPAATEAAFNGPHNLPGTVQVEDYDTGGDGLAYHDVDAGNSGGAYRSDNVDIEACSDTGGGYDVGWTAAGEYLKYTVNVATAGNYTVGFRVASTTAGNTFYLANAAGTNISGTITCPNTGGWQTWQTVNATVTLPAGTQVLKLVENTGGYNFNSITFTKIVTGSLTGSKAAASTGIYNLTSLGTTDWAHWTGTYIHKSSGGSKISDITQIGGGTYGTWHDTNRNVSWTGGTPTASSTDDTNYLWCNGTTGQGWTFTVPADTTSRTLNILCGGSTSGAATKIVAHLSDGSAADYTNTQTSTGTAYTYLYTITYNAASAGKTLTITLTKNDSNYGTSVDLDSAWLH